MEKRFRKVVIRHAEGESTLELGYQLTEKACVPVLELFDHYPMGIVFEKSQAYLQIEYQLTAAPSCVLLTFNEQGDFVSGKFNVKTGDAPVAYLIPEAFVVILPIATDILSNKVLSMEMSV